MLTLNFAKNNIFEEEGDYEKLSNFLSEEKE
jgi:hypothetical protein